MHSFFALNTEAPVPYSFSMSSPNRRENDRLRKVNRIMLVRSTKTSRIRNYRKGAKTAATSTVNIRQPFSQNLPTAARSNQQKG